MLKENEGGKLIGSRKKTISGGKTAKGEIKKILNKGMYILNQGF